MRPMSARRGRRPPEQGRTAVSWLLVLVGLALVLLLALGWQSWTAARSHERVADAVLKDYAEIAGRNFVKSIRGSVGYWWLYRMGLEFSAAESELSARIPDLLEPDDATPANLRPAFAAIEGVFRFSVGERKVEWLHGPADFPGPPIRDRIDPSLIDRPFQVFNRVVREGALSVSVVYPTADPNVWTGLVYDPAAIGSAIADVFRREPLLPVPLSEKANVETGIHLTLAAPDGSVVFRSATPFHEEISAVYTIGTDYGGFLAGYTVTTSLHTALAEQLIIGGLPASRLPLLGGLIALTMLVLFALMRLLVRENALANLRSDFVARVSHELRTPLTQIRLSGESLLLERIDDPAAKQRQLAIVVREAKRLSHMVSNVLALSSSAAPAHGIRVRRVELCETVREVIEEYEGLLPPATRLELIGCADRDRQFALADRDALAQVVINLVDNACRYGPERQTVRILIESAGDWVEIAVEDEGPGVPEAEKAHVWTMYYRLEREIDRAINGTGIGLPVARDLVRAMGGHCEVADAPTGGARFSVFLERAQDEQDPAG